MRKYSFSLVTLLALVAVALVFGAQPSKAQDQEQTPPELINIEIFTDMDYGEVRAEMNMIRDQLGARCRYCHFLGADGVTDYVPETSMKQTARQMIRMVQVLNEQEPFSSGNIKVTCATCHEGSPHIPLFVPGGRETWVPYN
jgi:cytochrome c556